MLIVYSSSYNLLALTRNIIYIILYLFNKSTLDYITLSIYNICFKIIFNLFYYIKLYVITELLKYRSETSYIIKDINVNT